MYKKFKNSTKLLALLVSTSIILTGCGFQKNIDEEMIGSPGNITESATSSIQSTTGYSGETVTIKDIKNKYGVTDNNLIKPFYNVEQTTTFSFSFNSKVEPALAVTVHTDPKCGVDSTVYQINDTYDNGSGYDIVVKPGSPVLNTSDRADGSLDNYNWGNAPVYYLSINYDLDATTPTKLDKPIIVPFTIKNNVSTPNAEANITLDGSFELIWKPVDGATKYNIYKANAVRNESPARNMTRSEAGYVGDHLELLTTVDANTTTFRDFNLDGTNNMLLSDEGVANQNFYSLDTYYVTAVDASGNESFFSMGVEGWKFNSQLPKSFDEYNSFVKDEDYNITKLPETVEVKMVDGTSFLFPINYKDTGSIDTYTGSHKYNYTIQGTALCGTVEYLSKDENYPSEIKSSASVNSDMYLIQNDINIIPDVTVSTINDSNYSNSIIDLSKSNRDTSKKISYNSDVINKRADIEGARIVNDGVYTDENGPDAMLVYGKIGDSGINTGSEYSEQSTYTENNNSVINSGNDVNNSDNDNISTVPAEPVPAEPVPAEPVPAEPVPAEPVPAEPVPAEPVPAEPVETVEIPDEITQDNLVDEQINSTEKQVKESNNNIVPNTSYMVFADSAEEEYLALNMIEANTEINLTAFPSLQNPDCLVDTILKTSYQNPYVIGVRQLMYNPETMTLMIEYDLDKETIKKQQAEIAAEAERLVKELFNDGMTDEDKLLALWQYLEDNTSYDHEACDATSNNDFQAVDASYADAFSTYGILCKKIGVCQSYAYTSKLLLSMVNVDTVTLTGYLDKTLPHAWNASKLGDSWYWFDATNNAKTTGIPFMLYKSSSTFAENTSYTLNDEFTLNDNLNMVYNSDNSRDWYYVNGLYANNISELESILLREIPNMTDMVVVKCSENFTVTEMDMQEIVRYLYENGISEDILMKLCSGFQPGYMIISFDE